MVKQATVCIFKKHKLNTVHNFSLLKIFFAAPKRVKRDASPASTLPNIAISYICRLHPKPGTLLLEKCVEEGVPPGPLYGQLKAGKDVTLECGKLIRAESVCSPSDPGPIFLVIDCPDESFLENLTINPKINQFRVSTVENGLETPEVVVHFTPNEVLSSSKLNSIFKDFRFQFISISRNFNDPT